MNALAYCGLPVYKFTAQRSHLTAAEVPVFQEKSAGGTGDLRVPLQDHQGDVVVQLVASSEPNELAYQGFADGFGRVAGVM